MRLYIAPPSKPSQAVLWFVKNNSIPNVEVVAVNLLRGDNMTADYTKKNVYQTVPMLELDTGVRLTESAAIMLYFAKQFNIANAIPADPMGEAQAISAMLHHDSLARRGAAIGRKILNKARNPKLTWDQVRESIDPDREELTWVLQTLEVVLATSKYIAGEAWSIADYLVAGELLQWATVPDHLLPEAIRIKAPQHANILRYLDDAKQQPNFDEFTRPFSFLEKIIDAAAVAAARELP